MKDEKQRLRRKDETQDERQDIHPSSFISHPSIYLDHFATTPCDPRVVEAMLPFFGRDFGNAHSPHAFGQRAGAAVDEAREAVAASIGARSGEIIFTSGATEANNLALKGLARWAKAQGVERRKIVTTPIEHNAVLEPCRALEAEGFKVEMLRVDGCGVVNLEHAAELIDESTLMVSVQAANNEIGTLQPVREIAWLAHERGALVHCDAAQAVGKIPVNVAGWELDFLSLSGHKLYGPKGIGALWARGGRRAPLQALWHGGNQEKVLRPGTLPVPLVVALGKACTLALQEMDADTLRLSQWRDSFERAIVEGCPGATLNGATAPRLPHGTSLTFADIEADALLANVPHLMLSSGSACDSGALSPSHVLLAIGLSRTAAQSTLRVAFGRFTAEAEVSRAAHDMIVAVERVRAISAP